MIWTKTESASIVATAMKVPSFVSFALFLLFYCVGGLGRVFIMSTP